ncbi:LacI family DNA-binding transcriptional regulator [uncultured Treponema sp.]|uniref:LacI family DNA-binding transcriptional regulator n=1 Tax=uncultured Treponema sp. TaxID=162155 RepID=UPI00260022F9|nr:LacI family DNA-binding transcriptional regulator [uncultured Treponema sp.]
MTIRDIARECGVGVGTVSRVINGQPGVKSETREKVQAVVNKHGFVVNQNAKLLKEQERKTIYILVKGTSNILFNSLLEIIQNRFEALPYNTSVVLLDEYDNEAQCASRIFYEQKPLGMVFLGGNPDIYREDFMKIQIPCVLITNSADSVVNKNLSSVSTDDRKASAYLTEYLIKCGHKKIGVIGGELKSSEVTVRRYESFLETMKKHGLDFDYDTQYALSKYSFDGAAAAVKVLLKNCPDLTAIFTMADVMAIGAVRSLSDMGLSVPKDISVVGFDGISIADFFCPRITTIRQKTELLAEQGISALLECIESQEKSKHTLLPFDFVEGESVLNLYKNIEKS